MALVVIGLVLWLVWVPLVVIVTLVQSRSVARAVLFALLLGPFALYVVPRLPPGKPANPGWYPYWYPRDYRHRYSDGRAWTDRFESSRQRQASTQAETSQYSSLPPPGWYPNPDGTEGHRWWNGQAWT